MNLTTLHSSSLLIEKLSIELVLQGILKLNVEDLDFNFKLLSKLGDLKLHQAVKIPMSQMNSNTL